MSYVGNCCAELAGDIPVDCKRARSHGNISGKCGRARADGAEHHPAKSLVKSIQVDSSGLRCADRRNDRCGNAVCCADNCGPGDRECRPASARASADVNHTAVALRKRCNCRCDRAAKHQFIPHGSAADEVSSGARASVDGYRAVDSPLSGSGLLQDSVPGHVERIACDRDRIRNGHSAVHVKAGWSGRTAGVDRDRSGSGGIVIRQNQGAVVDCRAARVDVTSTQRDVSSPAFAEREGARNHAADGVDRRGIASDRGVRGHDHISRNGRSALDAKGTKRLTCGGFHPAVSSDVECVGDARERRGSEGLSAVSNVHDAGSERGEVGEIHADVGNRRSSIVGVRAGDQKLPAERGCRVSGAVGVVVEGDRFPDARYHSAQGLDGSNVGTESRVVPQSQWSADGIRVRREIYGGDIVSGGVEGQDHRRSRGRQCERECARAADVQIARRPTGCINGHRSGHGDGVLKIDDVADRSAWDGCRTPVCRGPPVTGRINVPGARRGTSWRWRKCSNRSESCNAGCEDTNGTGSRAFLHVGIVGR